MVEVYQNEKRLFGLFLVLATVFWIALVAGTFGLALIWLLIFFVAYLFAQSAFISYIKGTAVEITPQQMPELHDRITQCSTKVGLKEVPQAYLLNGDGILNALATRFLGRNFIVLFSDIVDALDGHPQSLNFYIGHELGHIQRKHLIWGPYLAPAAVLPLLGAAYSRAREYTCDLYGLACCDKPTDAAFGLAVLAAGPEKWRKVNIAKYAEQTERTRGFWMSFHELISDYPWLVKRMERVLAKGTGNRPRVPPRSLLAWILALFVPRLGVGGSAAGGLIFVAMIGILAAVAIPAYQDYMGRAHVGVAISEADKVRDAVTEYIMQHKAFPQELQEIGLADAFPSDAISEITFTDNNEIVIVLKGNTPATVDKTLVYTAVVRDGQLYWDCTGGTVKPELRPKECR